MKKTLILVALAVMFIPYSFARSDEASPYLMGEWFLGDTFPSTPAAIPLGVANVTIADTQFTFLNPTNLTLNLEYAFFDTEGNFCGCDRDILNPNGRTRYTMSQEATGGQFVCTGPPNLPLQTEGTMKTIVFQLPRRHDEHDWDKHNSDNQNSIDIDNALQIGYQIHFNVNGSSTEAGLKAIPVTQTTFREIKLIHKQCVDFCNAHPGLCPPLQ